MKRIIGVTILALALAYPAGADTIKKEFDIASGKRLSLDLDTGGDIYIAGWDKEKVEVKIHIFGADPDDYDIDFDAGSSAVRITSDLRGRWHNRGKRGGEFEYDIKVPRIFDIEIETMGGEVNIVDVEGEIEGTTMGGNLDFRDIKGNIEFETMGGEIRVEKVSGLLDLETMGGGIIVTDSKADGRVSTMGGTILIEDVDGNLRGSTMGGNVTYRNVTGQGGGDMAPDEVRVSSMGGSISIDEAPRGATLETKGGGITVRSAKEFVKAETMGGNIRIYEIDGWVDAATMGGDVIVNMIGDPDKGRRDVEISSMGGDIELTVPDGLSMDVDIEIAYTKDSDQDYDIKGDFNIKKKRTDRWDGRWGSKKKYIYGTGRVAGGKHKIRISTINGDVYIKKGN
jgi:DUF4097 and DUF4098 domain-containing protein YvlB